MPLRVRWSRVLVVVLGLVAAAVARDRGDAGQAGGSLRIQILPSSAARAGGAAVVDMGAERYGDGAVVRGLSAGRHGVHFVAIDGYAAPDDQRISMTGTEDLTVVGKYVPTTGHGALHVVLTPAAAGAGARWTVDADTTSHAGGETLVRLPAGNHTVHFAALPGYVTPPGETVTVMPNELAEVAANYVAADGTGDVRVTLGPAQVVGAGWHLDDGPATQASDAILAGVAPGEHTVSFAPATGWVSPAVMTVTVAAGRTTSATATYTSAAAISFATVVRPLAQASCRCHGSTMTSRAKLLADRYVVPGRAEASPYVTEKAMQPKWGADRQKVVDWINSGANP